MVCVGIDVAKDKHDCFILSSEGEVLADVFTIQNNAEGFNTLLQTISCCTNPKDKIKVGLEATGHYSYNILGFLLDKGLPTYVINPLHTNLYRKSLSLRKTNPFLIEWEGPFKALPFDCLCLFSNGPEGLETPPSNSMAVIFKP